MIKLVIPDTLVLLITRIAIVIIGVLSVIITARYLSVSARGEFAFALTIVNTAFLFSEIGTNFATVRLISKYKRQEGSIYASALVLLLAKLICIIIVLLSIFILLASVSWPFKIDGYFLLIVIANSIPILISEVFFSLLIVFKNLKYYSGALFLFRILIFFSIYIGLLFGYSDIAILFLIRLIVSCLVLLIFCTVISSWLPTLKFPRWRHIIKIQFDGVGIFLSNLVEFSWASIIFFFIAAYEGYYVLGLFSVIFALFAHLSLFGVSLGIKAFKEASSKAKLDIYKIAMYCRLSVTATLLASCITYIFAPFLIKFIFTPDYLIGLSYMPALMCWVIGLSGWKVLWESLNGSGDIYGVAAINIFGAIFCSGSVYIILEFHSLSLAIWGQAASSWLCFFLGIKRISLHSKDVKFLDYVIFKIDDIYFLLNVAKRMIAKN